MKSLSFLLLLDITPNKKVESPCPSPDHRPHIAKKVSLRAFRKILPNIFPVVYIFSYIIMIKVKKLIRTKSFDTKQYQVGLSSRIIPNYPPNGDREEPQPTVKHLLVFPTKKIILNKPTSSTIKSAIPSSSNSNFHLVTLCQLHLQLQSLFLYHFFKFRVYVHICHVNYD